MSLDLTIGNEKNQKWHGINPNSTVRSKRVHISVLQCTIHHIHSTSYKEAQKETIFAKLMPTISASDYKCNGMMCGINLKSKVSRYLGVKKVQLIAMDLVNTWKKAQNMTTTYFNDQLVYVSHSLLHAIIIKTLNGSYNVTLTYFRLSCFVPFESVFPSLHTAIARKLQLKDMFKEIFKT